MYAPRRQIQPIPALAAAGIVATLALALALGLRIDQIAKGTQALVAVAFPLDRPLPPERRPKPRPIAKAAAPEGDPAPRNLENRATQIVAPKPPFIIKPPPQVFTAPRANTGDAAQTGASDLPGPGQGAGGVGSGFGGGGQGGVGNGRGGRGEPPVAPPRHIRGKLGYRDAPEGLVPEGREGHVGVLYTVNPDGRVSDCQIERPSGVPALDGLVCRLIEQRFVFQPARDRFGRPVRSRIAETHSFFGHPQGD